jgi:hypothetical protein
MATHAAASEAMTVTIAAGEVLEGLVAVERLEEVFVLRTGNGPRTLSVDQSASPPRSTVEPDGGL